MYMRYGFRERDRDSVANNSKLLTRTLAPLETVFECIKVGAVAERAPAQSRGRGPVGSWAEGFPGSVYGVPTYLSHPAKTWECEGCSCSRDCAEEAKKADHAFLKFIPGRPWAACEKSPPPVIPTLQGPAIGSGPQSAAGPRTKELGTAHPPRSTGAKERERKSDTPSSGCAYVYIHLYVHTHTRIPTDRHVHIYTMCPFINTHTRACPAFLVHVRRPRQKPSHVGRRRRMKNGADRPIYLRHR